MKKIIIRTISALLAIILAFAAYFIFLPKNDYYYQGKSQAACYGYLRYTTINFKMNEKDKQIAKNIVAQAKDVFEYVGSSEDCDTNVGALYRYYDFDCIESWADIEIITAKTMGNRGFVWVEYNESHTHVADNGEKSISGGIGLSFWRIKKENNKWTVTKIFEAP